MATRNRKQCLVELRSVVDTGDFGTRGLFSPPGGTREGGSQSTSSEFPLHYVVIVWNVFKNDKLTLNIVFPSGLAARRLTVTRRHFMLVTMSQFLKS